MGNDLSSLFLAWLRSEKMRKGKTTSRVTREKKLLCPENVMCYVCIGICYAIFVCVYVIYVQKENYLLKYDVHELHASSCLKKL